MQTKIVSLLLMLAVLLALGSCQDDQEGCEGVGEGLDPVVGSCRESVSGCVAENSNILTASSSTFCQDGAEAAFNNFVRCTNRTFSDQIFGAICGSANCTRNEATPNASYSECMQDSNRCFETVDRNDGTAAFQVCMCSDTSLNTSALNCSMECRSALEQLVTDIGCCVNTSLYVYYFSTCGDLANTPRLEAIEYLFGSCELSMPDTCLHPFSLGNESPTEGAQAVASAFSVLFFITILSILVI